MLELDAMAFGKTDVTSKYGPRIVAIANQKGGVGKTTTAINLAAAFAELGCTVLIVDLDPQGNASTGLGIQPSERKLSIYDVLMGDRSLQDAVVPTGVEGLSVIPSSADLASIDLELSRQPDRSERLKNAFIESQSAAREFDFVILDCPPSLNLLTVNAMVAANSVLLPLQSEFFALEGLSQLMMTIRQIRSRVNPELRIEGVLLTMHDARNNLAQQVEADARANLGDLVFRTIVPRNVRVSEAPSFGVPVLRYDTHSRGAQAYRSLANEIMTRLGYPVKEDGN